MYEETAWTVTFSDENVFQMTCYTGSPHVYCCNSEYNTLNIKVQCRGCSELFPTEPQNAQLGGFLRTLINHIAICPLCSSHIRYGDSQLLGPGVLDLN